MTIDNLLFSYNFDAFKENTDEYFSNYVPYLLRKTKEWLSNNWSDKNDQVEISHIRMDALSFAYEHYLETALERFPSDIDSARKYWFATVWFKLLDYLNYTYRDIVMTDSRGTYKKAYLVSLDSPAGEEETEYYTEKLLGDYNAPSSESVAIKNNKDKMMILFCQEIKEFVSKQFQMHRYRSITESTYVQVIHECLDDTLKTLDNRKNPSNNRATNLKEISIKHNINYITLHDYFEKFKADVRKHMPQIKDYLGE